MTRPNIDAIRARVEAATEGPWDTYRPRAEYRIYELCSTTPQGLNETLGELSGYEASPNAEFVAHARQDIPNLLAYIKKLEAQIERVRELHQRVETRSHYPMPPNWEHQKLVVCGHCKHAGDAAHPYPCPTIEALGGES